MKKLHFQKRYFYISNFIVVFFSFIKKLLRQVSSFDNFYSFFLSTWNVYATNCRKKNDTSLIHEREKRPSNFPSRDFSYSHVERIASNGTNKETWTTLHHRSIFKNKKPLRESAKSKIISTSIKSNIHKAALEISPRS